VYPFKSDEEIANKKFTTLFQHIWESISHWIAILNDLVIETNPDGPFAILSVSDRLKRATEIVNILDFIQECDPRSTVSELNSDLIGIWKSYIKMAYRKNEIPDPSCAQDYSEFPMSSRKLRDHSEPIVPGELESVVSRLEQQWSRA